jgi:hypothetical protein
MTRTRFPAVLVAIVPVACFAVGVAGAVTQDINLTATVPGMCSISDSLSPTSITQNLAIDVTGRVATTPIDVTFPIACNKPAAMVLTSSNFGLTGPAVFAGHDIKIDYAVTTSGIFPPVTLNTRLNAPSLPDGGSPYASASAGPANGTLSLRITPAVSTFPLAAGSYSDTLRLTVTPLQ